MEMYTLDKEINSLIDEAVGYEFAAQYFYTSAFSFCALKNYTGGKAFFHKEAHDEKEHADRLIEYAADWGHSVKLNDVLMPDKVKDLGDIIRQALTMEYDLCEFYKKAYKRAIDKQVNTAIALFSDYVRIQDEAVREYSNLLQSYEGYASGGELGVRLFDKEVLG